MDLSVLEGKMTGRVDRSLKGCNNGLREERMEMPI